MFIFFLYIIDLFDVKLYNKIKFSIDTDSENMNTYKRKIVLFILLALVVCLCVSALVSCRSTDDPVSDIPTPPADKAPSDKPQQHSHSYALSASVAATCTEKGVNTYVCSCGDSYTDTVPALGHDLSWASSADGATHCQECSRCDYRTESQAHAYDVVSEQKSTCIKEGSITLGCVCGKTETRVTPTSDHSFTVYGSDGARHWLQCAMCSTEQQGSRAEHNFDIQVSLKPATCTERGSKVTKCVCGETFTESLPTVPHEFTFRFNDAEHWQQCSMCSLEQQNSRETHDLKVYSQSVTCTRDGATVTACDCGYSHTETTPALGHDLDKSAFAQITEEGHYYKCSRCGENVIELHTTQDAQCPLNKEPTCGESGHQDKRCTVCGKTFHYTVPATGMHSWSVGDDLRHDDEKHWHYCKVCGESKGDFSQHEWQSQIVREPTCTENGSGRRSCRCGINGVEYDIQASGHKLQDDEATRREPTCTESGSVEQVCSVCGFRETKILSAVGHKKEMIPEKQPTETEGGWIEHWTCKLCGKNFLTNYDNTECPDSQIYLPATSPVEATDIAELRETAKQFLDEPSKSKFQITLEVFLTDDLEGSILVWDKNGDDLLLEIEDPRYDLSTINEGDLITVMGYLLGTTGDTGVELLQPEIISVDDYSEETATLDVRVSGDVSHAQLYAYWDETPFTIALFGAEKSVFFNSIWVTDDLTFSYKNYYGVGVRSIEINGESYTMTKGELTVKITGDMVCEIDLNEYSELNATVDDFDLPFNAPAQKVNGYLSYQFKNNKGGNGHIVADSSLLFTVKNAYITRVEIEFENYELTKVAKNTINVGKDADHKTKYTYTLQGTTLKLQFEKTNGYTVFEYRADVHQARIEYVKIYYETYNT